LRVISLASLLCATPDRIAFSATRLSLSFLRFCNGNAGENWGRKLQLRTMPARKSAFKRVKRLGRKVDRFARTFVRFVAVLAAVLAVGVYWNFGTLSPCGVLRETIRQRGDLVAIFPDEVIDFAFEAQFGEMSARRCFAVLFGAVTSPVPTTDQASQPSMQPFAHREGK